MTFELARANVVIDFSSEQFFADEAKAFNQATTDAKKLTEELAKQLKVREADVRAAAAIILADNRKAAQEQIKLAKQIADEQKKTTQELLKINKQSADEQKKATQELLKYNQQQYKADVKAAADAKRERLANLKAEIREEVNELKKREQAQKDYEQTLASLDKQRDAYAKKELRRIEQEIAATKKAQDAAAKQAAKGSGGGTKNLNTSTSILGINPKGIPGDIATLAGFGAIASGAIVLREAIIGLIEATTKQEQAQRSLNGAFGQTSVLYKQIADDTAKQFGLINADVEKATATFATLDRQTVLTGEQIRKLNQVAADNQAAFGGDLYEAHRALQGAILGETEAYEKYGVVLQEGVLKSSSKLTEDEKKRFTTMSESEKQMIRYRIILEEATKVQGAAASQVNQTQGGFNAFNRSVNELAKTLGESLVPQLGETARWIGYGLDALNDFIKRTQEFEAARKSVTANNKTEALFGGVAGLRPLLTLYEAFTQQQEIIDKIAETRREKARKEAQDKELASIIEHHNNIIKARQDALDREEAVRKVAEERVKATLQQAHDAEIKRIDDEIAAAEGRKTAQLRALEEVFNQNMRDLEDTENARQRASELELARIQNEKNNAIKAAEDRKAAELDRIEIEKDSAREAANEQIRQLKIKQEEEKRAAEDLRDSTIKSAKERLDIELKRIESEQEARSKARALEDAEIEKSITNQSRKLEDNHKKKLHNLELEGERLRKQYRERETNDDKAEKAEDDRHDKKMRNIEDEAKAASDDIDRQIQGIKDIQEARRNANDRAALLNRLSEAQANLRSATGTGDPAARAIAQQKLTAAIRLGDPTAIKKAQDELVEIVGKGTKAIAEAQQNLAQIQLELTNHDLEVTENAEIRKLEDAKDRIKETEEAEKRQEEDRNKRRKSRVDNDKKAEQERLNDALTKLERRQEEENNAYEKQKRRLDDTTKENKRQLDARRKDEDLASKHAEETARDSYEHQTTSAREHFEETQRLIEDTYTGEDHGYIPAIQRALHQTEVNYEAQKRAAEARYKDERDEIEQTYDNPETGLIAQHRRMEEDARNTYQRVADIARDKYQLARRNVEDAYNAPDKRSGIIDKLNVLKDETNAKLAEVLASFQAHKAGLVGENGVITATWKEALSLAEKYFNFVNDAAKKKPPVSATPDRRNTNPGGGATYPGSGGDEPGGDPNGGGQRGEAVPPAKPVGGGQTNNPPTTVIPPQVNQFTRFQGYNKSVIDAACGPAAMEWLSAMLGRSLSDDEAIAAAKAVGWTPERGMAGPLSFSRALNNLGIVHKVEKATPEEIDFLARRGIPFVFDNYEHYYQVNGGSIQGLNVGGSGQALIGGSSVMSLDQIQSRKDAGSLQSIFIPELSGFDSGTTFYNPTLTYDLRTGGRGILAENGPERLLGRRDTQQLASMGVNKILRTPVLTAAGVANIDPLEIGTQLGASPTIMSTMQEYQGDKFIYNGVAPEDIFVQQRADQRRQRVLRGVRRG